MKSQKGLIIIMHLPILFFIPLSTVRTNVHRVSTPYSDATVLWFVIFKIQTHDLVSTTKYSTSTSTRSMYT